MLRHTSTKWIIHRRCPCPLPSSYRHSFIISTNPNKTNDDEKSKMKPRFASLISVSTKEVRRTHYALLPDRFCFRFKFFQCSIVHVHTYSIYVEYSTGLCCWLCGYVAYPLHPDVIKFKPNLSFAFLLSMKWPPKCSEQLTSFIFHFAADKFNMTVTDYGNRSTSIRQQSKVKWHSHRQHRKYLTNETSSPSGLVR